MCAELLGIEKEAVNHYSWFFPQGSEQIEWNPNISVYTDCGTIPTPLVSSSFQEDYTAVFTKQQIGLTI
jgi:hypothetical protein